MNVLLTGGTGYIGSHTSVVVLRSGYRVVLYDNLSNSSDAVLEKLAQITVQQIPFIKGDVRDTELLKGTLAAHQIDAVVHFAGLKAVGESVEKPLDYYANNVQGTISLLQAMQSAHVKTLVFSSSATVYGEPQYLPLDESHPTGATNPYGRSKLHIEEMLADVAASDPVWRIACLRYFNPMGTHESGLIGESPHGVPNNLTPYIAQAAAGQRAELSVIDMIQAFEKASGRQVPYKVVARRAGDVAACYSAPQKASEALNWRATRTLDDMCASTWRFQQSQRLSITS